MPETGSVRIQGQRRTHLARRVGDAPSPASRRSSPSFESLSFIDYAVIGEGDQALPALVARLALGEDTSGLDGVISRSGCATFDTPRASSVQDMNNLPDPDYDEYFGTLFRLGTRRVLPRGRSVHLLIETGRGCWWGQKHHCTFCGLHGTSLT